MIFELRCPYLQFYVIVQMGDYNAPDLRKFAKKRGYKEDLLDDLPNRVASNADGSCWQIPEIATSVVWLPDLPRTRYQESILVHELTHSVQHSMDIMGSTCSELAAYLVGNFYDDAMKKVDEVLKKEKPPEPTEEAA